ncbi:hypothetical protein VB638_10970 [Dolichospermum sp. UHCC 0684]|uniref:hypothetical protein n=1 Tax=Dolichospermum sp. UHCC 0684 TaxID=3110242 RepID=UPI002B1ECC92|nr:hypothetical protein [Dolichospermum sp. UHCC 0684]MEA5530099.1 hypothetical protein [Dolichospermum sp. UHCC 0684]
MNINQYQPIVLGFSAMVLASAVSLPAQAVNILQNGNLIPSQAIQNASPNNSYRFQQGVYINNVIPGWQFSNNSYAAITPPGTAAGAGGPGAFSLFVASGQTVDSPTSDPAWFFNFDGDTRYGARLSQQLTDLTVGKNYTVSFYQAGASINGGPFYNTATWDQFRVSFGNNFNQYQLAPRIDMALHENVRPWEKITMDFTATNTSQWLSFLNVGGPGGQPPIALLTSVTVDDGTPPATPVPWETDALPLVGATMVFGAGVFVKRKIAQGKIKNLNFEPVKSECLSNVG